MGINNALMSAHSGDVYSLSALTNSTAPALIDSIYVQHDYGSYLKNAFWPNLFVGASFLILEILEYSSGLRPTNEDKIDGESGFAWKLGAAAKLNQNPIFQKASGNIKTLWDIDLPQEEIMPSGSTRSHPQIAFEEIEHTADRALRIYGRNFEELLCNAACGLNSLMGVDEEPGAAPQTKSIILDAEDAEGLLIEWLSELAFWAESEMLVFSKFDLQTVSATHVKAAVAGRQVTQLERHIKAVTYHNLKIVKTESGLTATVVFDV